MIRPSAIAFVLVLLVTAHCGAKTAGAISASVDEAGSPLAGDDHAVSSVDEGSTPLGTNDAAPEAAPLGDGAGQRPPTVCSGRVPTNHRPQSSACSPTSWGEAGTVHCSSDVDCADAGLFVSSAQTEHCLRGQCSPDQCLADSDCPGGGVCSCNAATGAYGGSNVNTCVKGNCRTDGDCAPGAYCSPSFGAVVGAVGPPGGPLTPLPCGPSQGVQGYYCHTCFDGCTDDSDCHNGRDGSPWCAYDQSFIGHWICGTCVAVAHAG
jgi:hypothetical protein